VKIGSSDADFDRYGKDTKASRFLEITHPRQRIACDYDAAATV
jgi:hypothetical protein